jgi:hypothetical protein
LSTLTISSAGHGDPLTVRRGALALVCLGTVAALVIVGMLTTLSRPRSR